MSAKFMSAVLAALNNSTELSESDESPIETVPDERVDAVEVGPQTAGLQGSESRFATIISSCLAKIRSRPPEE
jgi:hypothetical protein